MRECRRTSGIRNKRRISVILISGVIMIYAIENLKLNSFIDFGIYMYVIKPLMWGSLSLCVWACRRNRNEVKYRNKENVYLWSFIFGSGYVMIMIICGIFIEFGKSPYDRSVLGVISNLIIIGIPLVSGEIIRGYIIGSAAKESKSKVMIFSMVFFTLISFNLNKYFGLKNLEEGVKFLGSYFLPILSENIMASYLVYLGGAMPSIIYLGIIKAFEYFSPLLPNLEWIIKALIGILVPLFSFIYVNEMYRRMIKDRTIRREKKESTFSLLLTIIFSIGIVWFTVGVFPIYPSVIATGSMEPMIKPGDVILVKKVTEDTLGNLKIGDVIQFKEGEILICHRIINITEEEGKVAYKTKGDNNSIEDPFFVYGENVRGTVENVVPKIGWPTLLLKRSDEVDRSTVEF